VTRTSVIVLRGFASAVGITFFVKGNQKANSTPRAAVVVDPSALDFGTVWESEQFDWTIPMRNTSREPVKITSLLTSCHCTTVDNAGFEIPVGGTHRVPLKLDLRRVSGDNDSRSDRPFAVNVISQVSGIQGQRFVWTGL
jgi:hypothetical protein